MIRKLFCAALALAMVLALAACGASQTPSSTPGETPEGEVISFTRENFPRLDGSTATAPLAQAVAAVLLGESEDEAADLIDFSRTTESYRQLMAGNADLLIAAEPNAAVFDEMEAAGFEIEMEPVAMDALVFLVNADNPVDSLTLDELRGIYSGEITNWSEVGGDDLEIVPFQRNAESGSQVLMEKLVMDGLEMAEPPEGYMLGSMGDLMDAVKKAEKELETVTISDEVSDEVCDQCGRNMVIKYGPHGKFLACPGFPECKNTKPYFEKIGVKCPLCGGDVVIKKTKKGRKYYGCSNNPECEFMSWQKPTEVKCPECGHYMVEKGSKLLCSNEQCGHSMPKEK